MTSPGNKPPRDGISTVDPPCSWLERELKFDVDVDFVLPPLPESLGRWEGQSVQQLNTAYFDTDDHRLWRRDLTLRHRLGEASEGGTWTLKFPVPGRGQTLDRTELSWGGSRACIPAAASRLLLGITRSSPLGCLVRLESTRSRAMLHDDAGALLGELDDDTVEIIGGDREGTRFRQIEFEVGLGGSETIEALHAAVRRAGGHSCSTQKLSKAVSLPSRGDDLTASPARSTTMGQVVQGICGNALTQLLDSDLVLRIDPLNPPVEVVHHARVATRRLRSDLKLVTFMLDREWVDVLRAKLKWLGAVLGSVRDLDVLAAVFEMEGDGSSFDADGRSELQRRLAAQRLESCRSLEAALTEERYLDLLDLLERTARDGPPNLAQPTNPSLATGQGTAKLLARLMHKRQRVLRHAVRNAGRCPTDLQMHGLRLRAKELRYAADMAVPVVGAPARRTARLSTAVQDVLGEYHDTVAAEVWLRDQAQHGTVAAGYAAGRLAAEQWRTRQRLRKRWPTVWRKVDKRWLRT